MLPQLSANSAYRLKENKDYTLFLTALDLGKKGEHFTLTAQNNWGLDDLQMLEAVNILKDMQMLKDSAAKRWRSSLIDCLKSTNFLFWHTHFLLNRYGQIAQSVEQRTENPCVAGSIPVLANPSLVGQNPRELEILS